MAAESLGIQALPETDAAGIDLDNGDAGPRSDGFGFRTAVIDIGSNSIRLVVFEGASRAPVPIFNEKVMSGLGRGMQASGLLNPDGVVQARENLARFVTAASAMKVSRLSAFATAAVRDAEDGPAFVEELKETIGLDVRVLSGEDEARLSAYGVMSGFPAADGIVGDLGGGSLELVRVRKNRLQEMVTLPLGPLRLNDAMENGEIIGPKVKKILNSLSWLEKAEGKTLYAVGGAWRSLAKVHMAQKERMLRLIDGYRVDADQFADFAKLLARQSDQALARLPGISSKRLESVRASSIVLRRLIKIAQPESIVFVARGVREGVLYEALSADDRAADPLHAGAAAFGKRFGRFTEMGSVLFEWTSGLFPKESDEKRRLRAAACEIGDTSWFDHPDYRNHHAWGRILTSPLMGLDHAGRAYLALAVCSRYSGGIQPEMAAVAYDTGLDDDDIRDAKALGQALRLGYTITAGQASLLDESRFERTKRTLSLSLDSIGGHLIGNVVQKRFNDLASTLELEPELIAE